MSDTKSLSYLWTQQHRGGPKRTYWKIAHRYRWQAMLHAWCLIMNKDQVYWPYLCTWTDDYREGHVGKPHWHVGRPGRNAYGIAATARKIERQRVREQRAAEAAQAEAGRP